MHKYSVIDWLRWMPKGVAVLTDGSRNGRAAETIVGTLIRQEIARRLAAERKRAKKGPTR